MAIDLLNSFLQRNQNVTSNQKGAAAQTTQTTMTGQTLPQNLQVMRAIRALQAGQTIQGEVVAIKGKDVQLAILKDVIIDAKLAGSMNLTPGTIMPFQVKTNNSQGLSLIPLFTNIAADPNVLKALDMAQIPVNDRSLEMVQTLMEKGMPIDKQSVQEMYREVMNFKEMPVKDIVTLHQMEVPVNRDNLTQLSLYQNNQHYLKDTFSDMGSAIGGQLEHLIAEGKTESALNVVNQIQQLFQGMPEGMQKGDDQATVLNGQQWDNSVLSETDSLEAKNQGKAVTVILTEDLLLKEENTAPRETTLREALQQMDETGKQTAGSVNSNEDVASNIEKQKESNIYSQTTKDAVDWKDLTESLLKEKEPGKISRMFEKIWNKEIAKNWLLEPENVTDKKNVKEYYEKLTNQIKQLEKIFENGTSMKNPAAKAIQNTASNLDFMNQLNQLHAYIQLPLKMANQNAHGELYVFTNKKNLTKQDGKVTALLHLDMENLGKMDVYVALENKKVNTNFYLEKEEYLFFLEAHMELLTTRLNKRGYDCEVKTTLRNQEEESVIKTIEKQQGMSMMLSMQAFDVRA
ncbi:MAG: flagellar hook-length control protein FliK [Lachnospiraceae bacterium]|nr:flagellar hook-length control protein FliK [Lachnospiraceae bacterium]